MVAFFLIGVEQLGQKFIQPHFARIEWLVDAEFLLRSEDAVLRRLGEVKTGAAGGAELRDHFLVVRERNLNLDAGFLP